MINSSSPDIDFSVWLKAPQERSAAYFPVYASISRVIQAALRQWVREWFHANPELLSRHYTAYQILVYFCTQPFPGKRTNTFTYDVQRTDMLDRLFTSAGRNVKRELEALTTTHLPWTVRQRYFAYRYKEVVKYVSQNPRALYKMLSAETALMDAVLKFAITDIRNLEMDEALGNFQNSVAVQLSRFSDIADLTGRTAELLLLITNELARSFEDSIPPRESFGAASTT